VLNEFRTEPIGCHFFYFLPDQYENDQISYFTLVSRKSMKDRQHNGHKKNGQKDKQRSTKHTHKTKDRVT
jgi:hypothetical protein